ncbi:MAG TPA: TlpA disulfide reductase family protein, partial [Gemmataceae bacterium]|nr:TlpA disulfide reductase family protein [Gemmataceae bacterium]
MRHLLAGLVGLALLAPAWADDKKSDEKSDAAPKTGQDKFAELHKGFQKDLQPLGEEFQKAKTPEQQAKIRDKALKDIAGGYAKKMLALAAEDPKDPAAVSALIWVCTQGRETPQVPEAVGRLLKNHPDNDQLGMICQILERRPDGEALLRQVRTGAAKPAVKVQAGIALADALRGKNDEAGTAEAEKVLEEVVAQAKETNAPDRLTKQAEDGLKDVRTFGVGKTAPAAESKDLDDKKVALVDLKGKVVVLDFWATWCGPCKSMIPHERELVKKNKGKPLAFVSVSADDEVKTLKDFLDKESMPWTHWFTARAATC